MFVFWGMRWPHRRKERTVRVTGIASKNLCTISCEMPWLLQAESFQCGLWDTFSDTRSQNELWMVMYILQSMPEYTTVVWKPLSYTCWVIPSVLVGNTGSTWRDSQHFSSVIYSLSPIIRDLFPNFLTSFTSAHLSCSYSASHSLPHFFSAFSFLSSTRHTPGPIIWPRPPPSPCHYTRWLSCHSVPVATL